VVFPCGGNNVPITLGLFTIEGAEVQDAFNALADTRKVWDPLLDSSTELGDFRDEQAVGLALSFSAHPFQDREVYEWMVVNATDADDLWVVYSTRSNEALHLRKPRAGSQVAAQNCLGVYRFQKGTDGMIHATFTSHVNPHPFLVTAAFVYHLAWYKTVESINALRAQAQKLARERNGASPVLVTPAWMTTKCLRQMMPLSPWELLIAHAGLKAASLQLLESSMPFASETVQVGVLGATSFSTLLWLF